MPSGRVHLYSEMAILCLILATAMLVMFLGEVEWKKVDLPILCFTGAYIFSSLLLSPDLDLGRSDPQSRWGVFRILWKPYAKLFHHRGVSHNPLLGPLSRILYLGIIVSVTWSALHYAFSIEIVDIKGLVKWWKKVFDDPWLWAVIVGLLLPNEIHILADRFFKN
ncbi:MAG: DUF2227 family putative metal-binding protein [Gemmatimonadetes bacterium]|nr:DUF2227 family putative metal-binding protein [Gemmatimonadota bacterium]